MAITLDGTTGVTFPDGNTQASGIAGGQSTNSYPLKSGASVVAARLMSLNLSGEVGENPVVNTLGSSVTAANVGTGILSTDGSRMLQYSITTASNVTTGFYRGSAVNQTTAAQTVGATTVTTTTNTNATRDTYGGGYVYAISPTQFISMIWLAHSWDCCGSPYNSLSYKWFVLTVDASGNVTKSADQLVVVNNETNAAGSGSALVAQVTNNIFVFRTIFLGTTTYYTVSVSGTTITSATDAEAVNFFSCTVRNTLLTSSNIIVAAIGTTAVRTASYTTNNIGAFTDTTVISDNSGGVTWFPVGTTRLIARYSNTSGGVILRSFTVNQTTGALTSVGTIPLTGVNAPFTTLSSVAFKDATSGAFVYNSTGNRGNSISLQAGGDFSLPTFNTGGMSIPSQSFTVSNVTYATGNNFLFFYEGAVAQAPIITPYLVNAYATNIFNFAGVCKTSTSSSPVQVVTAGVATGFTGLTTGSLYYATAPYDGTVTTSSYGGNRFIGKAISTTSILLGEA
jgi:hypothetical protein